MLDSSQHTPDTESGHTLSSISSKTSYIILGTQCKVKCRLICWKIREDFQTMIAAQGHAKSLWLSCSLFAHKGNQAPCLLFSFFHPGWHFFLLSPACFQEGEIARSFKPGSQVLILIIPSERNEKGSLPCIWVMKENTTSECWLYKIISLKSQKRCPERIPALTDETGTAFWSFSTFSKNSRTLCKCVQA